jgi:hypothetical protein
VSFGKINKNEHFTIFNQKVVKYPKAEYGKNFAQKPQGFQKMDKNKCPIFNTWGILETTSFQK